MKRLARGAFYLGTVVSALAMAQPVIADGDAKIEVVSSQTRTVNSGASENFTGHVEVEQLFAAQAGRHVSGGSVTFKPGARSAWHTHPVGPILLVTAGIGLVQQWGDPIRAIRAGDVVWIPPGIKHWHGAAPKTSMTHIAIQEAVNGQVVDWMAHVSDE